MRDAAFIDYHNYEPFLKKIYNKFGLKAVNNIKQMNNIKLKRKILGD